MLPTGRFCVAVPTFANSLGATVCDVTIRHLVSLRKIRRRSMAVKGVDIFFLSSQRRPRTSTLQRDDAVNIGDRFGAMRDDDACQIEGSECGVDLGFTREIKVA